MKNHTHFEEGNMKPNTIEIYAVYLEHKQARADAGFDMAPSRAIEDTAYEFDISISDVVKAIAAETSRWGIGAK